MTESDELVVGPSDAGRLHELRRRILRENRPDALVADPRDDEEGSAHFAGLLDGRVVVCASFYPSTSRLRTGDVAFQLRFMATDLDVQGRGYGARVLHFAEADLTARGAQELWAHARDSALGFYRATGWEIISGSEHLSAATGLAHTDIVKRLVPVVPGSDPTG